MAQEGRLTRPAGNQIHLVAGEAHGRRAGFAAKAESIVVSDI
jgi:hypothetical protein